MLAGSLACIAAGAFAVAVSFGTGFGPGWSGTLLVAVVGFGLMIGALPMMFFGCEAHREGKTTGFAPSPEFLDVGLATPAPSVPTEPVPALALTGSHSRPDDHLSSYAVHSLAARR